MNTPIVTPAVPATDFPEALDDFNPAMLEQRETLRFLRLSKDFTKIIVKSRWVEGEAPAPDTVYGEHVVFQPLAWQSGRKLTQNKYGRLYDESRGAEQFVDVCGAYAPKIEGCVNASDRFGQHRLRENAQRPRIFVSNKMGSRSLAYDKSRTETLYHKIYALQPYQSIADVSKGQVVVDDTSGESTIWKDVSEFTESVQCAGCPLGQWSFPPAGRGYGDSPQCNEVLTVIGRMMSLEGEIYEGYFAIDLKRSSLKNFFAHVNHVHRNSKRPLVRGVHAAAWHPFVLFANAPGKNALIQGYDAQINGIPPVPLATYGAKARQWLAAMYPDRAEDGADPQVVGMRVVHDASNASNLLAKIVGAPLGDAPVAAVSDATPARVAPPPAVARSAAPVEVSVMDLDDDIPF